MAWEHGEHGNINNPHNSSSRTKYSSSCTWDSPLVPLLLDQAAVYTLNPILKKNLNLYSPLLSYHSPYHRGKSTVPRRKTMLLAVVLVCCLNTWSRVVRVREEGSRAGAW